MNIIEPEVTYLPQTNIVRHVAKCARVCYGREEGNDDATYNRLIKDGHWSMFRHASYYYIVPINKAPLWLVTIAESIIEYNAIIVGINITRDNTKYYIVTNGNWELDNNEYSIVLKEFEVKDNDFPIKHFIRYTFKVITQISTSRELNRVSPNNISEKSTRYVYENGTICRPHWMTEEEADKYNIYKQLSGDKLYHYIHGCDDAFFRYRHLIRLGIKRQDARGVLPLDTATICVYTYNYSEWQHIIRLRANEQHAHPNAVIIANMINNQLNTLYEYSVNVR